MPNSLNTSLLFLLCISYSVFFFLLACRSVHVYLFVVILWLMKWFIGYKCLQEQKKTTQSVRCIFSPLFLLPTVYYMFIFMFFFSIYYLLLYLTVVFLFGIWHSTFFHIDLVMNFQWMRQMTIHLLFKRTNTEIQFLNKWTMSIAKIILFKYISILCCMSYM